MNLQDKSSRTILMSFIFCETLEAVLQKLKRFSTESRRIYKARFNEHFRSMLNYQVDLFRSNRLAKLFCKIKIISSVGRRILTLTIRRYNATNFSTIFCSREREREREIINGRHKIDYL